MLLPSLRPSLCALALAACGPASAAQFAPAFSDHMVLQAGRSIALSGRARPGSAVTVQFEGRSAAATADANGRWELSWPALAPTRADEGSTLSVLASDGNAEVHDVLVGEVWLCSGQSNMRFALGRNYVQPNRSSPRLFPEELAAAGHPRLRLLNVSGGTPAGRQWARCSSQTADSFSAVGYFFGQALQPALEGEPIGLIDLGRGGEAIRGFLPAGRVFTGDLQWLAPFAVRGVLWYQGEADAGRAAVYPRLLGDMIAAWRSILESPDAEFLLVQLPVYQGHPGAAAPKGPGVKWAQMRAAQLRVADTVRHVAIAPALDLGERWEIHPHRKPDVGRRLARLAQKHVYGQPVAADAPRFLSALRQGAQVVLTFANAEGGIVVAGDEPALFECGTADGRFVPARARVTGDAAIAVEIPPGVDAATVRYGWKDYFRPDLFNGEGLPVLPFSAKLLEADRYPVRPGLPDALANADGSRVTTAAQWSRRRDQIRATLETYLTGSIPPAPADLKSTVVASSRMAGADYRRVHLSFGPGGALSLDVGVFLPAGSSRPVPTLIFLVPKPASPEALAAARRDVLARGYALLAYDCVQAAADEDQNRGTGFFSAYPSFDWGNLGAWAWGVSRCVDYLRTQPWADSGRIGVVGHSRFGKTALLAGAFDDRIALVVAAGSGCAGTGAFRINGSARQGKEGLEEITRRFPYWFGPRLAEFAGQVERLPFDQNEVMDLVAPRALLDCEASDDPYCNGPAALASYRAAQSVYGFLGAEPRLALHVRPGGHALTDGDWSALLDFAHRQFNL